MRTYNVLVLTLLLLICSNSYSQFGNELQKADDVTDDSETEVSDTTKINPELSKKYRISVDRLDCVVNRTSDSSRYVRETSVYEMYGNARIEYCDKILEANQINYNTKTGIAEAFGVKDTLGNIQEYAIFNDGGQELQYAQLAFNFKTQKGRVNQLVTQQGEGIVRGEKVKKINDEESFVHNLRYTTCNLDHPHYYFTFNKAMYKNDKFAAGKNLNLYIKDIPTPLYFPSAIFPMERGKHAGLTRAAPSYDQQRGFSLSNVGWYQPINDNMDAQATADFYTSGSWNLNANYAYIKRYKHRMNFGFRYSYVKGDGISDVLGRDIQNSFQLNYTFNQDPKVWPNANLNANISLGQSNYKQLNVTDPTERLRNTYTSSVSFNKQFRNLPVSLSSNLRYNQNTQSNAVSLSLPEVNLSTSTLYPFRGLSKPGKSNPFETLTLSYRSNYRNKVNSVDSVFFDNPIAEIGNLNFGASHSVPVSANFKLLKYFNISPSFNYNEVWANETYRQNWDPDLERIVRDTVREFRTARWYTPSVGLNTTVYGMKQFKPESKIQAIRHVIRPSLSFNYNPDFRDVETSNGRYFEEVQFNEQGDTRLYSVFDGTLFGGPPSQPGGSIGLNVGNNLEMKVKSKKDTVDGGIKKIKIFESLSFNTNYSLAADSLNLSNIRFSGNTTLFDKFRINLNGSFNPYEIDGETGRVINRFRWREGGLPELTNASFRLSGSLNSKRSTDEAVAEAQLVQNPLYPGEQLFVDNYLNRYVDFTIPWDLSFNYTMNYRKSYLPEFEETTSFSNAVSGNFDFLLTDNWKVSGKTGYDFESGQVNYTNLSINRDLHCWQMSFNWSPIGSFKQYMFTISPKSSMLSDFKLEKRRTVYQNFAD